jgi:tRNA pseudouridine55 synthase
VDGVLLIDKPAGPTSHDVVARMRRATGERRIGHTGTLDPRATGLLPLVLGRATRLASLLTGVDKTYDATIHLGISTDTDDVEGTPIEGAATADLAAQIDDGAIDLALDRFRGSFEQRPPAHSAKKIAGRKAYDLARRAQPVPVTPVPVTVYRLERTGRHGALVDVSVTASSGFYVRALARDLGDALGCGGHLQALRRTRSGQFDLGQAIPLEAAERAGAGLAERLVSPADALPGLLDVTVNDAGLRRATHGNPLGPEHLEGRFVPAPTGRLPVKVLDPEGRLVALAHSRGGALHPVVVLG